MTPTVHLLCAIHAVGGDVDDVPDDALEVIGIDRPEAAVIARLLAMSAADLLDYYEALHAEIEKAREALRVAEQERFDAELVYWMLGGDVTP
jgi:hypothetical protein